MLILEDFVRIKCALLDRLSRKRHRILFHLTKRRTVAKILVGLLIVWYFWPGSWFRRKSPDVNAKAVACRSELLAPYFDDANSFDVSIYDCFDRPCPTKQYIPFIGNGHFGLSPLQNVAGGAPELRVKYGPSLKNKVSDVDPLVKIMLSTGGDSGDSIDAFVTDYKSGVVTHIQVWLADDYCISAITQLFFHRHYSSLLVQDIAIKNPSRAAVSFKLTRPYPPWKDETTVRIPTVSNGEEYKLFSSPIPVPNSAQTQLFTVALPAMPDSETLLEPYSNHQIRFISGLYVSEPVEPGSAGLQSLQTDDEKRLIKAISIGKSLSWIQLLKDHAEIWMTHGRTGLSLSFSKAPDVLNGDLVNATVYYIVSNTPAPLHEWDAPPSQVKKAHSGLTSHGQCYAAHNTLLYPSKLWSTDVSAVEDVVAIARVWKLTLEKRGCGHLFEAGADGLLQAIVLSFGGFKFTSHHLEFNTHPAELHRDHHFRGIRFNDYARINVTILIGHFDNMASMYAAVDKVNATQDGTDGTGARALMQHPSSKLYACDAGCLDTPLQLTEQYIQVPVKLTDPVTPLLYITADKPHLVELKDTIHVKEVNLAPAAEHDVVLLHKHGHRLGGLPLVFWITLTVLVVMFHLFLFKLVYNEYFSSEGSRYYSNTGRYSI